MAPRLTSARGFSLVELAIATGIGLAVVALTFQAVAVGRDHLAVGLNGAEQLQRLRVALSVVSRAMERAGAPGGVVGQLSLASVPRVLPFRVGAVRADSAGSVRTDLITLIEPRDARARLAAPLPATSGSVTVDLGLGCASTPVPCGFRIGSQVMAFDPHGGFDLFETVAAAGASLQLDHLFPDTGHVYPVGASLVEVELRSYFLKTDPRTGAPGLAQYDGRARVDVPVVDHVAALRFDYWGDQRAAAAVAVEGANGEVDRYRSTYGPAPPLRGVVGGAYPDGENCLFARDSAFVPVSRLLGGTAVPGAPPGLVRLAPAELGDGPWCPDDASPVRYDADLFRIRGVDIWMRLEAVEDSRGGPGRLFSRGGTAFRVSRWVPDTEVRVRVSLQGLGETP